MRRSQLLLSLVVLLGACKADPDDTTTTPADTDTDADSDADADTDADSDTDTDTDADTDTDTDTDTEPAADDARLVLGGEQACAAPLSAPTFTEGGASGGLRGARNTDQFIVNGGGAIAVEDFDRDGDLDIALGFAAEPPAVYWNQGDETFTVTALAAPSSVAALNAADIDNDGFPDLLIGAQGNPAIYRNTGEGGFVLASLPPWSNASQVKELAPNDIDRDGDVDLYALIHGSAVQDMTDIVLWNDGTGTFTADEDYLIADLAKGQGFDAAWFDWQDDGDMDVYVCNDNGTTFGANVLFAYEDGDLTQAECDCHESHFCMGVDFADYNGDGIGDMFLTDAASHKLLQGLADGTFIDTAQALGVQHINGIPEMAWGAMFVDWDNDGDQDILMAMGNAYAQGDPLPPDDGVVLMDQLETGEFVDIGPALGFEQAGNYRSVVAADFNGDGVLDHVATDVLEAPQLYLSTGCTVNGWLSVHAPLGSRVEVEAGGRTFVDWVHVESSQGASGPPVAHLGLGAVETIDRMVVKVPRWSLGEDSAEWVELVRTTPFPARQIVTVDMSKE